MKTLTSLALTLVIFVHCILQDLKHRRTQWFRLASRIGHGDYQSRT